MVTRSGENASFGSRKLAANLEFSVERRNDGNQDLQRWNPVHRRHRPHHRRVLAGLAGGAAPARGRADVLFFVLDDVGYGQLSCFGGLVETPVLDSVAANGLRYSNMHTTALCSPSRAAS